ncbi:hypothetical protein PR048_005589 [Dryococelus australis]|uniref:Uncharacterized protein n=1 Tax=Dryococelus australis TaxID=614101 RepID=A0ABQ9I8L7_9NEOP|nr:hypothetical protein PR048_005589 [Dryococelus australis]
MADSQLFWGSRREKHPNKMSSQNEYNVPQLQESRIYCHTESRNIKLPLSEVLSNSKIITPYVLIGDEDFPLAISFYIAFYKLDAQYIPFWPSFKPVYSCARRLPIRARQPTCQPISQTIWNLSQQAAVANDRS